MEKLNLLSYKIGSVSPKAEVNMEFDEHENMLYDYSFMISVFRVNIHDSPQKLNSRADLPLNKDDILCFVMVYYDDGDGEPDQRFLTFFKGDPFSGEKEFHGN